MLVIHLRQSPCQWRHVMAQQDLKDRGIISVRIEAKGSTSTSLISIFL
jgi:hypothetical protein